MKPYGFLYGILLFLISGCEPEWPDPYTTFIIPAGEHSAGVDIQLLQVDELKFQAVFDESAIYTSQLAENQWDINKLMGFSDCNSHHHENSARFGWRWLDDQLEIMAYCYVNGERISEKIGELPLNTPGKFSLKLKADSYSFSFDSYPIVEIPRQNTCDKGAYYMLWPYFGGDETAPHEIRIRIQVEH